MNKINVFITFFVFSIFMPVQAQRAGVCFFDIDSTLTYSPNYDSNNSNAAKFEQYILQRNQDLVQTCLDHNFAVSVVTGSGRELNAICNPGPETERNHDDAKSKLDPNRRYKFIPDNLCQELVKQDDQGFNYHYNSRNVVAGRHESQGIDKDKVNEILNSPNDQKKPLQMRFTQKVRYGSIKDECIILFDNDYQYTHAVRAYKHNYKAVPVFPILPVLQDNQVVQKKDEKNVPRIDYDHSPIILTKQSVDATVANAVNNDGCK